MHATCSIATFKDWLRLHSFDEVQSRTLKPGLMNENTLLPPSLPVKKPGLSKFWCVSPGAKCLLEGSGSRQREVIALKI
ncbi:hypothetical protein D0A34_03725 [Microcoleus vaginatus PCC 9802]|nr:hypothetical protein D0A34_03725 [Microcoleus vaginatus PCC 9802]